MRKTGFCRILCAAALLPAFCVGAPFSPGDVLEGFEFVDREFSELFYMLSLYSGIPICADDTVEGRGTFRLALPDFEQAFDAFLASERLYAAKSDELWTVSRMRLRPSGSDDGSISLDASDIRPVRLLEKLSLFFGTEISYDSLPDSPVSVHAEGKTALDFVLALSRQLGQSYSVQEGDRFIRIFKESAHPQTVQPPLSSRNCMVTGNPLTDSYSLDVENAPAGEVLEKLFSIVSAQYVFSCDVSRSVRRIVCHEAGFQEALGLVCDESGLSCVTVGNVMYVVQGSASPVSQWRHYGLSFLSAEKAVQLIQARFGSTGAVALPGGKGVLCDAPLSLHDQMAEFLLSVDVPPAVRTVRLQYITVQELLSCLPPSIPPGSICKTTQDTVFFFTGTDAEFSHLEDLLSEVDCPVRQVRYDVLIVQYQSTEDFSWEQSLSAERLSLGDRNSVSALLGSVLSLNVNVVSAFGLDFASSLQTALDRNHASVFADTTLHGVSGGTISFRNTNTYRYRDNNIDPDTGKPVYTGVTREIVSGLRLEITGWVSGDGMITSTITASVSRQGADLSSKTGNPPPTSEKTVTTQVRAKSGEPIVLSGLVQDEEMNAEQGVPLLSRIPLLGMLFKSKSKTSEHTEMVIYLVPHWEQDTENDAAPSLPDVPSLIEKYVPEVLHD